MKITVRHIGDGPIITPNMDDRMGNNINGPSLIKVPEWLPNPLGRYYLYFGRHDGGYIRLAYADDIAGPWKTHLAGVLPLKDSLFAGHIASPDVMVDDDAKQIRLYFHGSDVPTGIDAPQVTRVALSNDGLNFDALPEVLGKSYMRVMKFNNAFYAIAMPGIFYRSRDGLSDFEAGPCPFEPNMRHSALLVRGSRLLVFYSRVGDMPEHILLTEIDLASDWKSWRPGPTVTVLKPERDYEGASQTLGPSKRGFAVEPVHELRDPAVYEENGETYLLYSVAGESGIAIAQISFPAD